METTSSHQDSTSSSYHSRIEEGPVLAVVDGSTPSYKAVWWAANYAYHAQEDLQIICTLDPSKLVTAAFEEEHQVSEENDLINSRARQVLTKAKTIALSQGVSAKTFLTQGDPHKILIELSHSYHLMVIGNRFKGGLVDRLFGSTSSNVAAMAYCPIVVVPYSDEDDSPLHLKNTLTRVAVGIDDSFTSDKVLLIAAKFANSWDAELTVVSAIPQFTISAGQLPVVVGDEEMEHIFDVRSQELKEKIRPVQEMYPDLQLNLRIVGDSVVDTLVKATTRNDIVIIGCRGHAGIAGFLLGSTTQGLIERAQSPVYVVPKRFIDDMARAERDIPAHINEKRSHEKGVVLTEEDLENESREIAQEGWTSSEQEGDTSLSYTSNAISDVEAPHEVEIAEKTGIIPISVSPGTEKEGEKISSELDNPEHKAS